MLEFILILLFTFLKFYLILGCIFTLLAGLFAFATRTENEYTTGEIFTVIFIYPIVIYYLLNPEKNDYER
jgi:hypothetical protein